MGYVFDFNDAIAYQKWLNHPANIFSANMESRLIIDMLKPLPNRSIIDIGCGSGWSLVKFIEMGLQVSGIDPSPYMLDIASKNVKNHAELYRGYAESLPFEDNAFHYACLITTLEFVNDPFKSLQEAFRVAKDRVFIGVLNRYAFKGIERRIKGMFTETIYNHAHFFSIWELKHMIRLILGDVPVSWGTVCQFPFASGKIVSKIEQLSLVQKCPFGAFVGLVVTPVPRFKTRPLAITGRARRTTDPAVI